MKRREFVRSSVAIGATALVGSAGSPATARAAGRTAAAMVDAPGEIRQSVCKWCFPKLSLEELAGAAKQIGLQSVELLTPEEWPVVQKHGLTCALGYHPTAHPRTRLVQGWNRPENHQWLIPEYEMGIRAAARAGIPTIIAFSGNRDGMSDEQGLENCAAGLRRIAPLAEKEGVTVVMELLNSKVNHPDYMCDHTAWGVELVQRVGSERFKLLYDIYHMQIMEGDVIRTIKDNHQYIGHYHTAGNPGRHEIDDSQELNYPAIMRAIKETGYQGFVGQEFIPTRDPLTSLAEAYRICNV